MMAVKWLIGFVAGAVAAAVSWLAMRATFRQPLFARRNYRGVDVPVGVGVLVPIAAWTVTGAFVAVESIWSMMPYDGVARLLTVALASGFSLLGIIDDVAATGDDRGFSGHLRALAHGTLTTGGLKLLAGGLLSVGVAASSGVRGFGYVLVAALVISLAANLGNLFDRAPGRTCKVGLLAAVPLFACCAAVHRPELVGVAIVLGAIVGLGGFDLREELMLGDAGSNVLGAVLGLGLVLTTEHVTWFVTLGVLVILNVASERVSFSQVFEGVAPLRAIDRIGRRRDR